MEIPTLEVVDDGAVCDSRGRRHRPRSERERITQASFESDLSLKAFARSEGVNYHTLVGWRLRYKSKLEESKLEVPKTDKRPEPVHFTEFRLPERSSGLEVHLPDGTLLRGDDAEGLSTLVKALRC